jgi:hypothetical protein
MSCLSISATKMGAETPRTAPAHPITNRPTIQT